MDTFPELSEAYLLKERYRRFNLECDYEDALLGYHEIIQSFVNAAIPEYDEFIGILRNWGEEIFTHFKWPSKLS